MLSAQQQTLLSQLAVVGLLAGVQHRLVGRFRLTGLGQAVEMQVADQELQALIQEVGAARLELRLQG